MSIRIEINDVLMTSKVELVALAEFLTVVAGERNGSAVEQHKHFGRGDHVKGMPDKTTGPVDGAPSGPLLNDADNPATGAPHASEVFGKSDDINPPASSVFGGNVPAGASSTAVAGTLTNAPVAPTDGSTPPSVIPPPPPPPVANGLFLDKDGLPWDSRIHASTRTQTADGRWKAKRGADPALIVQVTGELRAMIASQPAAPAVAVIPPPPPPPVQMLTMTEVNAYNEGLGNPPPPSGSMTWPQICLRITSDMTAKTLTQERLQEVLAAQGIPAFPLLATFPDRIPAVALALGYIE